MSSRNSSSFGCQKSDDSGEKKKPKRKATAKAKAKNKPDPQKQRASGRPEGAQTAKAAKAAKAEEAKITSLIENASKLVTLLDELTCVAIWRSAVRTTEVDRRLGRVPGICADCEDALKGDLQEEVKDKISHLHSTLQKECDRVSALKDLCKFIRGSSAEEVIQDVSSSGTILHYFGMCWESVIAAEPTMIEMIQFVAKKLLEVSRLES